MGSTDPFHDLIDLTGEWSGYYRYGRGSLAGLEYPLRAALRQDGRRLAGSMLDDPRETLVPLREVFEASRSRLNRASIQVYRSWLRDHPEAAVSIEVPAESDLRGRLRRDVVLLTKTYRGLTRIRHLDGDEPFWTAERRPGPIQYAGSYDMVRDAIAGAWRIDHPGLLGRLRPAAETGSFRLERRRA